MPTIHFTINLAMKLSGGFVEVSLQPQKTERCRKLKWNNLQKLTML